MQLHIVINTENKKDLQAVLALLTDYEVESAGWELPKKPVVRAPDQKGIPQGFVEAARGVQSGGKIDPMQDPYGKDFK